MRARWRERGEKDAKTKENNISENLSTEVYQIFNKSYLDQNFCRKFQISPTDKWYHLFLIHQEQVLDNTGLPFKNYIRVEVFCERDAENLWPKSLRYTLLKSNKETYIFNEIAQINRLLTKINRSSINLE